MKQNLDTTRRQLGELEAMAHRTAEDERRILARAEELLAEVESELTGDVGSIALAGDAAAEERYLHLVEERGRLQQVIASAQQVLEPQH